MPSTVWKGFLTFGLVSIPVRLYAAARSKSIHFNRMYRREKPSPEQEIDAPEIEENLSTARSPGNLVPFSPARSLPSSSPAVSAAGVSRVTQEFRPVGEEGAINPADLVRGYEYRPNEYVVVEKDEIQDLTPKTSTNMDLQQFVKLSEVDPLYLERSYYVAPEPSGEKAYALLFKAMQRTDYCGLASVAMHRRQHIVILRPDKFRIVAHTMYYVDEIREGPNIPLDTNSASEKELRLAEAFINALARPFRPENFRDEYRVGLESLIEGKMRAAKERPAAMPTRAATNTVDILQALQASLDRIKTPKHRTTRIPPKSSRAASGKKGHRRWKAVE